MDLNNGENNSIKIIFSLYKIFWKEFQGLKNREVVLNIFHSGKYYSIKDRIRELQISGTVQLIEK